MDIPITITVNGQRRSVTTDSSRSLLEVLREDFHLTGTKYGCGESQCGACTVLLEGKSIRSCTLPASKANNKTVQTIEGLADGDKLHPVQEAFMAEQAYQCGCCIPGMIMELAGLLNQKPVPADTVILSRMQGHICRCCGYPNLVKAIRRASALARS